MFENLAAQAEEWLAGAITWSRKGVRDDPIDSARTLTSSQATIEPAGLAFNDCLDCSRGHVATL